MGDSMASVFVDRMLGVLSVLLMALLSVSLARDLASDRAILAGLAATGDRVRRRGDAGVQ